MKKFLPLLLLLFVATQTTAQAPQAFKYQAVACDINGNPLINQAIAVRISILSGSPDGTALYSEIHPTTTTPLGLINLEIGNGTVVSGSFHAMAWGNNACFIKTEIDTSGGENFVFLGTSQLLSVPYSLFSDNGVPDGQNPGDMLYWNGTEWVKVGAGQNGQFLIFSNGVPTWGGVHLPILNTSAVTNITAFTAYSGGTIASDGGSLVTTRGICWNNSPAPTVANFKITAGSGSGNFLAQMTGLESSTQYFVRAFATNSAGTSYGQEMTFYTTAGNITLSTTAVTKITTTTATSGGNITLNGGSPVTARGVCWNTAAYPTTAHFKTTDGTGNGIFVSQLTGLTNNTQYYIRAYATNSLGTSYGNQLTFTTLSGIVTLTTAEVTGITDNSATSGGEITSDGGYQVTARGVCWSTSQNPTLANSSTNDGNGNGIFVSSLTNLLPDTLYYVRAYATNGVGTYYGNEVSFTTPVWECGFPITDSRDGQTYNTVQIGEQCWMAENLNVGARIDGNQNQQNNGAIEKYCYDNLETNCDVYGGLYQWDEMMEYSSTLETQGICPDGWYLPSVNRWMILSNHLGGLNNSGGKLKDYGYSYWNPPNTGATNSTGFTGLPGGYRDTNGAFSQLHLLGLFRSSDQHESSDVTIFHLTYLSKTATFSNYFKQLGISVRCLKENEPLVPFNPSPETGSTTNSINPILTWSCFNPESVPIDFDVFFGTENPPTQVATAIADTFYTPGTLNYNTTYYWKIVASDDHNNCTEGEIWSFMTLEEINCPQSFIDSRDGKNYSTVQIGDQCWMAENLNIGIKIDGSQNQQNNGVIEKYCYDNLETNCNVYGGLYQWDEMMGYSTVQGIQGICPTGWHLPNYSEWTTLSNYVSSQTVFWCNNNIEYIAKSLAARTNWFESTSICSVGSNLQANNSTGFTGLPGGLYQDQDNTFYMIEYAGLWWSSTQYTSSSVIARELFTDNAIFMSTVNAKGDGNSVRCLRD